MQRKGNMLNRSYFARSDECMAKNDTKKAMNIMCEGITDYSNRIIRALTPYPTKDAGLLVIALRHLADQLEKNNTGAKELYDGLKDILIKPELKEEIRYHTPENKGKKDV